MRVSAATGVVLATGLLTAACGVPVDRQEAATSAPTATSAPSATSAPTAPIAASAPTTPTAAPARPDPAVGAVFVGGGTLHTCSAAVLDSAAGDLILTAAHCLAGGIDTTFIAGFRDDAADDDVWHVDAVYMDERWLNDRDPHADFAIARVSRDAGGSVRTTAGGGFSLGQAPHPGAVVTVTGYGFGVGGGPVSCTAPTSDETGGFPSLPCIGLADGLSGAPWVDGSTVLGIVGGLHAGGCDEKVSYSPPFDGAIARLLARAEAGGPADTAPSEFDDECD